MNGWRLLQISDEKISSDRLRHGCEKMEAKRKDGYWLGADRNANMVRRALLVRPRYDIPRSTLVLHALQNESLCKQVTRDTASVYSSMH